MLAILLLNTILIYFEAVPNVSVLIHLKQVEVYLSLYRPLPVTEEFNSK